MKEYFFPLDSLKGEGKTYVYQQIYDGDTTYSFHHFIFHDDKENSSLTNQIFDYDFLHSVHVKLDIRHKDLILKSLVSSELAPDSTPQTSYNSKIEGGQLLKWKTKKGKLVTYTSEITEMSAPDSVLYKWEVSTTWHGNMAPVMYQGKEYLCVVIIRESKTLNSAVGERPQIRQTSRQYFAKGIGLIRMENSSKSHQKDGNTSYTAETIELQKIMPGLVTEK